MTKVQCGDWSGPNPWLLIGGEVFEVSAILPETGRTTVLGGHVTKPPSSPYLNVSLNGV